MPAAADDVRDLFLRANALRFHCLDAGPTSAPPVLLLHGFPDFSRTWHHQLSALASAGFRAIAPDLRGYNLSDKPPRIADYHIDHLVADIVSLIDTLSPSHPVPLVGHDWGGIIAFYTAARHPSRVHRLAILNAPHPAAYARELRRSDQLLRSWYVFLLQIPRLPEAALRSRDYALARRVLRRGPARTASDLARHLTALRQPRALESMIHYYRAAFRSRLGLAPARQPSPIVCPTLLLWGDRDPFLTQALTEDLDRWIHDLHVEHCPDAGHWLHLDRPDWVNSRLLGFVPAPRPGAERESRSQPTA